MDIVRFEKQSLPAIQLKSVNIPDIQRAKCVDVVKKIYDYENEYYMLHNAYIIPGCISVAKWRGVEYLVDGQHRLSAYLLLAENFPERKLLVSIDYYVLDDRPHDMQYNPVEILYARVNTCTPNVVTTFGLDKYKITQQIDRYFTSVFGKYVSKNARPNCPNINVQSIITMMSDKQLIERTGLSGDKLCELIRDLNTAYSKCTEAQFKAWHIDTKYLAKITSSENRLYLGLWRAGEWIDRLIDIHNGYKFETLCHYSITYRPKITKTLRRNVWLKHGCMLINQPCYVCGEDIQIDSFHCGHVIAVTRGGKTDLSNLEPICAECNKDMGVMNLCDYKELKNKEVRT